LANAPRLVRLLTSSPEGRTTYIQADLREPSAILDDPVTRVVLDFSRPVALLLVAVLPFLPDEFKPWQSVATLVDALPSGSYVVASHVSGEDHDPAGAKGAERAHNDAGVPLQ
jgi:O-methyltransferase involved in polyketide biosynthesis